MRIKRSTESKSVTHSSANQEVVMIIWNCVSQKNVSKFIVTNDPENRIDLDSAKTNIVIGTGVFSQLILAIKESYLTVFFFFPF